MEKQKKFRTKNTEYTEKLPGNAEFHRLSRGNQRADFGSLRTRAIRLLPFTKAYRAVAKRRSAYAAMLRLGT
ncbi:MAG TPA: hypothetical protein PLU68_10275, partial [Thermotogota bacterium]|nr:hypothetical protein [Thermotogota bacterium]